MRILYFSRAYTVHDQRFLKAILVAGHQVAFLRLEPTDNQNHLLLPKQVEEFSWNSGREPFSWRNAPRVLSSLRRTIEGYRPDLLHAGPLTSVSALAARVGFRPLVQMSWGSDILWEARRSWISNRLVRYALSKADALIGDCEAVASAAQDLGFARRRIVAFPWGVELNRFTSSPSLSKLRKKLKWEDAIVVLHLRNWERIYGVEDVARSFVLAARKEPALRLLMLGSGSLESSIKSIFHEAGVLDRVHFPGQISQDEMSPYFRAADIYLSASYSDGSSVSLMEALASGLPVLVSDIPGNREWITEGQEGWFFPPDNVEALSHGIGRAVGLWSRLPQMGQRARRKAEQRADWRENQKGIFEAYKMATNHYQGVA